MIIKRISHIFISLVLIAAASLTNIPLGSQNASAVAPKCDTSFYDSSNIIFFNPCSNTCSGATEGEPAKAGALNGEDNKEKIFNFFVGSGLSSKEAAGITANFQAVSNYSPFHQQGEKAWPSEGYGIANFTGGQRTAVTDALKKDVTEPIFTSFYVSGYGGEVSEDNKYMPTGITEITNDSFLISELNYVYKYATTYVPSTSGDSRVADLKTDHNLTIDAGMKLMDYIKSLDSEGDVAKAWTYLFEYPANRKTSSVDRSIYATSLVKDNTDSDDKCSVGAGGLNFEQATNYAQTFHTEKKGYFLNELQKSFWAEPGQVNQCTALVMYSVNRYAAPLWNTGNGHETTQTVVDALPGFYTMVSQEEIKPFSVFSLSDDSAGHTGMILGILEDGSVIIAEANVRIMSEGGSPSVSPAQGLIEAVAFGSKIDGDTDDPGVVVVEHWASIDAWIAVMASWGLTNPTFAAPTDPQVILQKIAL